MHGAKDKAGRLGAVQEERVAVPAQMIGKKAGQKSAMIA